VTTVCDIGFNESGVNKTAERVKAVKTSSPHCWNCLALPWNTGDPSPI